MSRTETKKLKPVTYLVIFPTTKTARSEEVKNPLRWWNTHYKRMHEWEGGRVEVAYSRSLRGFDKPKKLSDKSAPLVHVDCPYCQKHCFFHVAAVDSVRGHIVCPFCRKGYGVHPSGQIFVARDVHVKVAGVSVDKEKVGAWLRRDVYHLDVRQLRLTSGGEGVEVECAAKHNEAFRDALGRSGFEFRRLT